MGTNAADYQCLDFDKGTLPPVNRWAPSISRDGTLTLTTERATSAPYALLGKVPAGLPMKQATAKLTWSVSGSKPLRRITMQMKVRPVGLVGVLPKWEGSVDLACIETGTERACLRYSYAKDLVDNMPSDPAAASVTKYTGLFVHWQTASSSFVFRELPLIAAKAPLSMTAGSWNDIEIVVDINKQTMDVSLNKQRATCDAWFNEDSAASLSFGPEVEGTTTWDWAVSYDDVIAYLQR